jgi:hypothetical protein
MYMNEDGDARNRAVKPSTTGCINCAAGQYTDQLGSTVCKGIACTTGTYAAIAVGAQAPTPAKTVGYTLTIPSTDFGAQAIGVPITQAVSGAAGTLGIKLTGGIVTTENALIGSASVVEGEDLTETITEGTDVAVLASSITTDGVGTGVALKYTTASTTSISAIAVTTTGSGYMTGDKITIAAGAMLGRDSDAVFTLVSDDITNSITTVEVTATNGIKFDTTNAITVGGDADTPVPTVVVPVTVAALTTVECVKCAAGKTSNAGFSECVDCAIGKFADEGAGGGCESCDAGKSVGKGLGVKAGGISCVNCVPGKFASRGDSKGCQLCAVGTYTDEGATSCKPCAAGTSVGAGLGVKADGSDCSTCVSGKFAAVAAKITADTAAANAAAAAAAAPADKAKADAAASEKVKAEAFDTKGCQKCAVGRYLLNIGVGLCQPCIGGKSIGEGLGIKADGSDCINCVPGKFAAAGDAKGCQKCAVGMYEGEGASSCKPCNPGTTVLSGEGVNTDGSSCAKCPAGTFAAQADAKGCQNCLAGTYSLEGAGSCAASECGKTGEGNLKVAAKTKTDGCVSCLAGFYQDDISLGACKTSSCTGAFTDSVTKVVHTSGGGQAGTYSYNPTAGATAITGGCTVCPAGQFTSDNAQCTECLQGQFQDERGMNVCKMSDCCLGSYAAEAGQTTAKGGCTACAAGYFAASRSATACTVCPVGTFADEGGLSACKNAYCAPGKYHSATGIVTTVNALIGSASVVEGEDLTETITEGTDVAVLASSITTDGVGTGVALKYSTTSTTSISTITVTTTGSGYLAGDKITIAAGAMLGRDTAAVFTLTSGDIVDSLSATEGCLSCAAGTWSVAAARTPTDAGKCQDVQCAAGFSSVSPGVGHPFKACSACSKGAHSPGGAAQCTTCLAVEVGSVSATESIKANGTANDPTINGELSTLSVTFRVSGRLFDGHRIEIGTLLGSSTAAGLIRLSGVDAKDFSDRNGNVGYGNWDPLTGKVQVRLIDHLSAAKDTRAPARDFLWVPAITGTAAVDNGAAGNRNTDIRFDAAASSSVDDFYTGCRLTVALGATGSCVAASPGVLITHYNGATRTAEVATMLSTVGNAMLSSLSVAACAASAISPGQTNVVVSSLRVTGGGPALPCGGGPCGAAFTFSTSAVLDSNFVLTAKEVGAGYVAEDQVKIPCGSFGDSSGTKIAVATVKLASSDLAFALNKAPNAMLGQLAYIASCDTTAFVQGRSGFPIQVVAGGAGARARFTYDTNTVQITDVKATAGAGYATGDVLVVDCSVFGAAMTGTAKLTLKDGDHTGGTLNVGLDLRTSLDTTSCVTATTATGVAGVAMFNAGKADMVIEASQITDPKQTCPTTRVEAALTFSTSDLRVTKLSATSGTGYVIGDALKIRCSAFGGSGGDQGADSEATLTLVAENMAGPLNQAMNALLSSLDTSACDKGMAGGLKDATIAADQVTGGAGAKGAFTFSTLAVSIKDIKASVAGTNWAAGDTITFPCTYLGCTGGMATVNVAGGLLDGTGGFTVGVAVTGGALDAALDTTKCVGGFASDKTDVVIDPCDYVITTAGGGTGTTLTFSTTGVVSTTVTSFTVAASGSGYAKGDKLLVPCSAFGIEHDAAKMAEITIRMVSVY